VKSTPQTNTPIGGMITSATKELTTFPNAQPMMIPIAISTTLPFTAKS
jgi:predicted phage gp36 major capsid-like protein